MDLIRPVEEKVKAARMGSRLQNRACDQCRRSKRRCDLAEAGGDGLPIQYAGPCKLCVRKNLQCTTHWSELQQSVSSSRQELRQISQTSASYSALHFQLSSHQYLPAGLSSTSKNMSDQIDGLYISTKQLFTYIASWEWIWQHFLGSGATPAGIGLDTVIHPRRGLLSDAAARAWDDMMAVNNVSHLSPNFFYSTFVCDELYRPTGRFRHSSKKADEISMQALQYAIIAYASQYGSQDPGEWRGDDNDSFRRQKDTQIAEAAWIRARNFLMANSSVTTFRMAYAFHLFSNTCPPLRSLNGDLDVLQDAMFTMQTGLRMMDDLATNLLRQQHEDLFALGFNNAEGVRIVDDTVLTSDPAYRARVDRAEALKDVAEILLWYSAICDAAAAGGLGLPPAVRSSTREEVDIGALQLSAASPVSSIAVPSVPFDQNGYNSITNISPSLTPDPNLDPTAIGIGNPDMLRLDFGLAMPAAIDTGWSQRKEPSTSMLQGISMATSTNQDMISALSSPVTCSANAAQPWYMIARRAIQVSKQIPQRLPAIIAAPGNPARVKELLTLCQAGVSTQIMIWIRLGNFKACLNKPDSTAAELSEHFQRTWSMILFVQQAFEPLLDLDSRLFVQLPASAQSMATHLINQVGKASLLFLELCSFLEGLPWLQGSKDPSWPRASAMLQNLLDESRDSRNIVRRRSALRIGRSRHMVDEQVERTLRNGGSPPHDKYSSVPSSDGGSGYNSHRSSDAGTGETPHLPDLSRIEVPLPQDDMIVPALQIHSSRHPVPTHLASVLHISFCALVPDALQQISQYGAASPLVLDLLDANLRGLQGILDSVLSFGPFFHREPGLEALFETRNWLAPDRQPLALALR